MHSTDDCNDVLLSVAYILSIQIEKKILKSFTST